ncbi:MAG: ABC transporter permease, partial [Rhodospirillaceae bacterium]|nr:ABC transporter permease [Rhodospirillaceae bacterium]
MSIRRIWVVATNVFRSVVRDRVLYLLGLFTLILLLASRLLPEISSVAAEKTLI